MALYFFLQNIALFYSFLVVIVTFSTRFESLQAHFEKCNGLIIERLLIGFIIYSRFTVFVWLISMLVLSNELITVDLVHDNWSFQKNVFESLMKDHIALPSFIFNFNCLFGNLLHAKAAKLRLFSEFTGCPI